MANVLSKPCDDTLPVFGAAHYTHRADAGADLVRAGFAWDWLERCWLLNNEIRATVRWSETFGKYYVSAI